MRYGAGAMGVSQEISRSEDTGSSRMMCEQGGMPRAGAMGGSRLIPGLIPGLGVQRCQEGIPWTEVCWVMRIWDTPEAEMCDGGTGGPPRLEVQWESLG